MSFLKVIVVVETMRRALRVWRRTRGKSYVTLNNADSNEVQVMLLNGKEIRAAGLIDNDIDDNEHFRAASYDVRIGKIINVRGKELKEMRLKPQGVVEVVSAEKVRLPMDIAGFAMVKTGLCNLGILPLNIGIIDPGYKGYLSATLLNFGKREFRLKPNQVFLRLTFFRCQASSNHQPPEALTDEQYIEDKKDKVMNFSETFLNIKGNVDEVVKKARNKAIVYASGLGVLLALFAFLVTIGVNYTSRYVWSKEQLKTELLDDVHQKRDAALEQKLKDLEDQIRKLNASSAQVKPTP